MTAGTNADEASDRQRKAATPGDHVWVSANAGSGKTRVLIDRVARLLLVGTPPQNILCLTYTKAAASEMQNRLFERLGSWSMMPDDKLGDDLRALGESGPIDSAGLARARRLFAGAIEAPGGLRIQTIHAFCASVLRRFPLEAGISPQFREMEDREAQLLRAEIVDALAEARPDLLAPIARLMTIDGLSSLVRQIVSNPGFGAPLDEGRLAASLGAVPGQNVASLIDESLPIDTAEIISRVTELCRSGSANDVKLATALSSIRQEAARSETAVAIYMKAFLTQSGKEPFSAKTGSIPTKGTRALDPDLMARLDHLMETVEDLRRKLIAQRCFETSCDLHRFGHAMFERYAEHKTARGLVDFDDLIGKVIGLLDNPDVASWVLFKLDGRIDHILVDEAQDTSPVQWKVIRRLAEEFGAGLSARSDIRRTLFVVGDKKQSIYSFQGAAPEAFDEMRTHFEGAFDAAGDRLFRVPLEHSFRSSSAILRCVDETFVGAASDGVEEEVSHLAFQRDLPGRVEVWPTFDKEKQAEKPPWYEPLDLASEEDPKVQLAMAIAQRIRQMIDTKETIPVVNRSKGQVERRPITAGDVLILVRRRSPIFHHLIRACKSAGLDIAGADRLTLTAQLAVKDILSVLRVLALPEDDLSFAEMLRSPLFDWSEQDLFSLAHHRPERQSLWEAFRKSDLPSVEQTQMLADLMGQADFLRPFDLIDRLLNRWSGRSRLLRRMGDEAEDSIDALLAQALIYEGTSAPSLTGFLGWMASDDIEIKREMDSQGDRIRVMTVHGAKGLEAPIVILPDTSVPVWQDRDKVVTLDGTPVWKPVKTEQPAPIEEIQNRRRQNEVREWRRLLYVAMTRAETWLWVCATGNTGKAPGDSWHGLVSDALDRLDARQIDTPFGDGAIYELGDWTGPPIQDAREGDAPNKLTLPDLPKVEPPPRKGSLSPSDLGGSKILPGDSGDPLDGEDARQRGTLFHRLLELLPSVPAAQRMDAGLRLIASGDADAAITDAESLVQDAIRLIESPALDGVFGPDGLSEVELSAPLASLGGQICHGAIDRLIVDDASVLAVDFKTNRLVPDTPQAVPEGLLRQMGAYHAMLRAAFPDKSIRVAILWTATADLMSLPEELVSAALERVTVG